MSTRNLTDEDIEALKSEFLNLDTDGDGTITIKELGKILRSLRGKLRVSEVDIKRAIQEIDVDGDGTINLKEYMKTMENKTNRTLIHRALVMRSTVRKQFERFDVDGSGYVTVDEVKIIFEEKAGIPLTNKQVEGIIKGSDRNSDGKINYEEFVVMMTK